MVFKLINMKKLNFALLAFVGLSTFLYSCGSDSTEKDETNTATDSIAEGSDFETISFKAEDGVDVYANVYEIDKESPVIVLCHQAQFNKFEYEGTAQRLNEMGFNCIAIDQRSGGPIANEQNQTNLAAKEQGVGVGYLDAIPDIQAAVQYASDEYEQDVILWGSSYSSSLVLWEGLNNDNVRAVVSFSPGDYFAELGSLTDSIVNLEKPFFITSADFEVEGTNALLANKELGEKQVQFAPEANGHHGSRALWVNQDGGEQYWEAITEFLNSIK